MAGYLEDHPATAPRTVLRSLNGTDSRLQNLVDEREEFDYAEGPRGAKLWVVSSTVAEGEPQ